MPTIKDIARAAGVSHGTVSNVLNKTGKVSAQKMRLVEEAAKRLGYVPNAQAQLLRQGAANRVVVIVPTLRDTRYVDMFTAIQARMITHDFEVSVFGTDDLHGNEERLIESLPLSNVAAVVTVSGLQERAGAAYRGLTCPLVAVNRPVDGDAAQYAYVRFDHRAAGEALARDVLRRGWRRLAFFCTAGKQAEEEDILCALRHALRDEDICIERFSSDTKLITNKAFDILQEEGGFDGILAMGSLRADAVAVAMGFLRMQRRPQIICVGASHAFPNPAYETYEMDYGLMGARIAEMLTGCLRKKTPLPHEVEVCAKGFSFAFPHIKKGAAQQLTMLTLESPAMTALDVLAPELEAVTGIRLKVTSLPHSDLYEHLALIGSRFHYDLIRMDIVWLEGLGRQVYMPLEEAGIAQSLLGRGLVSSTHSSYYRAGGVLCAVPFDPSVQVLLYRSDLFEDATLKRLYYERYREALVVPQTIAQYARVAAFFTRALNPDSPTQWGTTITSGSALVAACDFLPFYLAGGSAVCDAQGHALLDTPQMRAALSQYRDMKQYVRAEESQWWRDSVRMFADGSAAMVHTFSNHMSYMMNSKRSNVVGKTGVAVMPGGHPLLGGGVLGICRFSEKAEACARFMDWFYTPDVASAMVRLGGTSPLANACNGFENFSVFPWLSVEQASFAIGTRGSGHPDTPNFSSRDYEYALGTAVRNVLSQAMTPQEAAAFAQAMYDNRG